MQAVENGDPQTGACRVRPLKRLGPEDPPGGNPAV